MVDHTISKCRHYDDDHPYNQAIPEYPDTIEMGYIPDETREDDFYILFHCVRSGDLDIYESSISEVCQH